MNRRNLVAAVSGILVPTIGRQRAVLAQDGARWTSPDYAHTIGWEPTIWETNESAVTVDADTGINRIDLSATTIGGAVSLTFVRHDNRTPLGWLAYWFSPDVLYANGDGFDLLAAANNQVTAGKLTRDHEILAGELTSSPGDFATMVQMIVLENSALHIRLNQGVQTVLDLYQRTVEGITLNGEPLPLLWSVEELGSLLEL